MVRRICTFSVVVLAAAICATAASAANLVQAVFIPEESAARPCLVSNIHCRDLAREPLQVCLLAKRCDVTPKLQLAKVATSVKRAR
jgi:hypothetical protein